MIIYHTTKEALHRIFSAIARFQCSWCRRWQVDGEWVDEIPNGVVIPENISHGICPKCYEKYEPEYRKEIEKLNRDKPISF